MRYVLAALVLALMPVPSAIADGAPTPQECAAVTDAGWRQAIDAAEAYVAKSWIQRGPDWHAAFDTAQQARNPFALGKAGKAASGAEAVHGFVWARDVACAIKPGDAADIVKISFVAKAFRFSADNKTWSKPQKDGLLIALEMTLKDGAWQIADRSSEFSVLLPDAVLRLPKADELPNPANWPDNRCRTPKHWEGKTCVAGVAGFSRTAPRKT